LPSGGKELLAFVSNVLGSLAGKRLVISTAVLAADNATFKEVPHLITYYVQMKDKKEKFKI
jgi:hypothetical protein